MRNRRWTARAPVSGSLSRMLLPVLLVCALGACFRPPGLASRPSGSASDEGPPPAPPAAALEAAPTAEMLLQLSVEEAILLALQNNRELRVRRYDPVIAGTFEMIEWGTFDPEVYAEFEYFRERASEVSRSTGERFSVRGEETATTAGVRQRLPWGTDVDLGVAHRRETSSRTPEQQQARVGLTVTQALLRGFGPAVNLASVRQAEANAQASRYELEGFVNEVLADTNIAYWNLVLAEEGIRIVERSLEVARSQRDAIEQQIEVGALPRNEAAAARAEVAVREQALIDARALVAERRIRLLRLVSPPPHGRLDRPVHATTSPTVEPDPITNPEEHILLALRSRPEMREARLRLEERRLETVVTRNGLLPRLDVFVAFGRTGYAESFGGAFRAISDNTYDVTGGVRFSHVLGNRAAEGRNVAAWASRYQATEAISNLEQVIRLDVLLALNEVERARQQIAASAATRRLREQTAEAERDRFKVGSSTTLLVAQAQRDLLESEIDEVRAVVNYRIARVRLYLAEGTVNDRHGIALEGGRR